MIGGLKTIVVRAGHEHEFEMLFGELSNRVRDLESDCLVYSLLKSRTNPRSYIVQEQYRDQAAFTDHEISAHGTLYFPKIRAILESITVEYFDGVAG